MLAKMTIDHTSKNFVNLIGDSRPFPMFIKTIATHCMPICSFPKQPTACRNDLNKSSINETSFFPLNGRVCTEMLPAFSCIELAVSATEARISGRSKKRRRAKARTPSKADLYLANVPGFIL